eukprot:snap_masked-scaffold_13-processed-gene-6.45-mRNA-1 protein AED:1.00 eAED:1.00 QI:0/-1/0/0/-1/1/1/0/255
MSTDITDRERQEKEILEEINKNAIIGKKEDNLRSLYSDFEGNPQFLSKLPHLEQKYTSFRRIRGDGNCFYRALAFRLFEEVLFNLEGEERTKMYEILKEKLISMETRKFVSENLVHSDTIEMFQEGVQDSFPTVENFQTVFFTDEGCMDLIYMLRLIASAYVHKHWNEKFAPFAEVATAAEYAHKEIETWQVPAEQIAIMALCNFIGVPVTIEYLDLSASTQTNEYKIDVDKLDIVVKDPICLLYRPGHYDIIYQ